MVAGNSWSHAVRILLHVDAQLLKENSVCVPVISPLWIHESPLFAAGEAFPEIPSVCTVGVISDGSAFVANA